MSRPQWEDQEINELMQKLWNKPLTRVIVGIIAFIAGIAKILEFFLKPGIPSGAKLFIWIVLLFAALPFVAQAIVRGINRQIESALEQRMLRSELPITAPEAVTSEVAYTFDSKIYGFSKRKPLCRGGKKGLKWG